MLLGGAFGQVLGGIVAPRYGWQMALFLVAIAGIIPALALLDSKNRRAAAFGVVPIVKILSVPAFLSMIGGGICITFASVRFDLGRGFRRQLQGFQFARSVGDAFDHRTCFGDSWRIVRRIVADRFAEKILVRTLIAIGMALLLATPFLLLAIQSEEKQTVLAGLFAADFYVVYHGPVTAVIHDMMPRRAHSTSMAFTVRDATGRRSWSADHGKFPISAICKWRCKLRRRCWFAARC